MSFPVGPDPIGSIGDNVSPRMLIKQFLAAILQYVYGILQALQGILRVDVNSLPEPVKTSANKQTAAFNGVVTADTEAFVSFFDPGWGPTDWLILIFNEGGADAVIRIEGSIDGTRFTEVQAATTIASGTSKFFNIRGPWFHFRVYYANATAGSSTTLTIQLARA